MIGNFASIGKMLQAVANNVKPTQGVMGGLGNTVQGAAQSGPMAAKAAAMQAAQTRPGNPVQNAAQMAQNAAMAATKAAPVIQKAAYIAVLHEAIAKAGDSASFNLEFERSELMTKFRNISAVNYQHMMMQEHLADATQFMTLVSELTRKMTEASRNVVSNLR